MFWELGAVHAIGTHIGSFLMVIFPSEHRYARGSQKSQKRRITLLWYLWYFKDYLGLFDQNLIALKCF